ncbi:hypothetical protein PV963_29935 [Streptomyces coeruleorubidus]|nr:hypothetical protein [Streptomyces coeruleorubidus]WDV54278.1 hypothetical protein PV963_29935 [Streptomyces coeruleorubidus]
MATPQIRTRPERADEPEVTAPGPAALALTREAKNSASRSPSRPSE